MHTHTAVEELHHWHMEKLTEHPSFERIPDDELAGDVTVAAITNETEEGKKVERSGGKKYLCVFRRLPDAQVFETTKESWPAWTVEGDKAGGDE